VRPQKPSLARWKSRLSAHKLAFHPSPGGDFQAEAMTIALIIGNISIHAMARQRYFCRILDRLLQFWRTTFADSMVANVWRPFARTLSTGA
jgi:hypothetical protein